MQHIAKMSLCCEVI